LEFLARNSGRVVSRPEIAEHVWDETYDPFTNLIEVYIGRLRRKVDGGSSTPLIHTRPGTGDVLAADGRSDRGGGGERWLASRPADGLVHGRARARARELRRRELLRDREHGGPVRRRRDPPRRRGACLGRLGGDLARGGRGGRGGRAHAGRVRRGGRR